MEIKIRTHGVVKDFFEPRFVLQLPADLSVARALEKMLELKPEAETVLKSCKTAIDDEFVDLNYVLKPGAELHFLPPASGG